MLCLLSRAALNHTKAEMFRIKLLWVGKTKETFLQEGIQQYQKKLRPYLGLSIDEVPASHHRKIGNKDSIREETKKILQKVKENRIL